MSGTLSRVFLYRMPAGIPGDVTRPGGAPATIEQVVFDQATPPAAYGIPLTYTAAGKARPVTTGDAAAAVKGWLVRPYPTTGTGVAEPVGTAVPNITVNYVQDMLTRGYMSVLLRAGVAAKGGAVYVRVATPATGKPIGGVEAAADGANTILVPNCEFTGPADAGGITEIKHNI